MPLNETYQPTGERRFSQRVRPCVAMEHAADSGRSSFGDHGQRVVLGVARVDDDRAVELEGEGELRRECASLQVAWRMVVVRVEPALADRDRAALYEFSNRRVVADGSKSAASCG